MKALLCFICAVAVGYVAYEYIYPPFGHWAGVDKPKVVVVAQAEPTPEVKLVMP